MGTSVLPAFVSREAMTVQAAGNSVFRNRREFLARTPCVAGLKMLLPGAQTVLSMFIRACRPVSVNARDLTRSWVRVDTVELEPGAGSSRAPNSVEEELD